MGKSCWRPGDVLSIQSSWACAEPQRASSGGCPHHQCFCHLRFGMFRVILACWNRSGLWLEICLSMPRILTSREKASLHMSMICQWYANCLAHLMVAREMERRAIVSGMIAIHPGVIRSEFMKPKNCCEGCILNCCDCSRINVVAGAQSSIHAATCPSTDLREEIIYFHSNYGQYGCYVLKPNDLVMVESRCQALLDECDFCCAWQYLQVKLSSLTACFCTKSEDFCQKRSAADW